MLVSVKIKDNDRIIRKIRVGLRELKPVEVVAGIQKGAMNDGVQVAEYAVFNEFGTRNIPARPFMRTAFDNNVERMVRRLYAGRRGIVDGKTDQEAVMSGLGVFMQTIIKESIVNGDWAPNAPYTIAKKGSSKPLVDSGTMLNSVTFSIQPYGTSK